MGLDMYLTKKTYVKQWDFKKPEEQFEVVVKKGGVTYPNINPKKVTYVEEEVMYWRKANHIHNWFVENVQAGVDECQTSYVSRLDLEELLETLKKVEASLEASPKVKKMVESGWANGEKTYQEIEAYADTSVAEELFPTAEGFFFGGTEYSEYYLQEVKETIVMLEAELAVEDGADYSYHASW